MVTPMSLGMPQLGSGSMPGLSSLGGAGGGLSVPGMSGGLTSGMPGMSGLSGLTGGMGGMSGIGGGAPGLDAGSLQQAGVSSSTLMLMSQINIMMASVMTGLMAFMQQIMASAQQRQQQAPTGQLPGGSPGGTPGSSPGSGPAPGGSPSGPGSGNTPPPGSVGKGGNVDQWVKEAQDILRAQGVPDSKMDAAAIKKIIQRESGGNPKAINNWDSNAKKGTPSKGILQTIDSTFNANKVKGYDDIWNPVHNIAAAVKYMIGRYGSASAVAARSGGY